jgi:hypothetical protein
MPGCIESDSPRWATVQGPFISSGTTTGIVRRPQPSATGGPEAFRPAGRTRAPPGAHAHSTPLVARDPVGNRLGVASNAPRSRQRSGRRRPAFVVVRPSRRQLLGTCSARQERLRLRFDRAADASGRLQGRRIPGPTASRIRSLHQLRLIPTGPPPAPPTSSQNTNRANQSRHKTAHRSIRSRAGSRLLSARRVNR